MGPTHSQGNKILACFIDHPISTSGDPDQESMGTQIREKESRAQISGVYHWLIGKEYCTLGVAVLLTLWGCVEPCWVMYVNTSSLAGGVVVVCNWLL